MVIFCRDNPTVMSIKSPLDIESGKFDEWESLNAKSISTIILCLVDAAMTKARDMVDGNGTVKELWVELDCIFTCHRQSQLLTY